MRIGGHGARCGLHQEELAPPPPKLPPPPLDQELLLEDDDDELEWLKLELCEWWL